MIPVFAWRPAVLAAIVPALALTAAPAFAQTTQDPTENPQVFHTAVSYGDLDLTTAKGRHALERRLRHGAAEVCDYDLSERRYLAGDEQRKCFISAMAHARVSMAAAITRTRMASSH